MEKYKLIYAVNGEKEAKKIFGSVAGIPAEEDVCLIDSASYADKGIKLIYEKDGKIFYSVENVPTEADVEIITKEALTCKVEEEVKEEVDETEETPVVEETPEVEEEIEEVEE